MGSLSKKRKIFISTEGYPYRNSEAPFIEPELEELLKEFHVTFISHVPNSDRKKVQSNKVNEIEEIKVYNINIELKWYDKIKYFVQFLFDSDGRKEIGIIVKEKKEVFSRIYQSAGFFALALQNYKMMVEKKIFPENEDFIYYSYWYYYYTYSMTRYKKKYTKMKIITRAHGFDLYDERYAGDRQPFKIIMDSGIDRIAFISEQGKGYYLRKYNLLDSIKYSVNQLGTQEGHISADNQKRLYGKHFKLVSCSSLIPLKRVDLLIEALSLINEKIEWIHFGDGIEYVNILRLADKLLKEKENVLYYIKGFTPNQEILEYYKLNYIDCFISTSSTEGLPVSIQEAMAFRIPIIATNVGGVSELLDNNGILLAADPTPNEVAEAIRKMIYMDEKMYQEWRKNSYKIWNVKYNAKVNSKAFVEMLKSV